MKTKVRTLTFLGGALLLGTTGAFGQAPVVTAATTSTTASATVGQTVTINSTAFVVSARKQLATGVEYYTMKPTTVKAKAATFLRTNNAYNATVFTQAQYEAFMTTGKLSSFGTLGEVTVKGTVHKYTTKGTTTALLGVNKDQLIVYEFLGPVIMLSEKQDDPTTCDAACKHSNCVSGCLGENIDCHMAGRTTCGSELETCYGNCGSGAAKLPMRSVHKFKGAKPILKL